MITRTSVVLLHEEADFKLSYDILDIGMDRQMLMIHLDVHNFSRSVLRRLHAVVDLWRPKLPPIIFTQPANDSPLFEKFVSRFGWQFLNDCICEDGQNRRIFVNYLRNPNG